MKYKVGDKVRIKKNLSSDTSYGKYTFVSEMEKFEGESATITQINGDAYQIDIDNEQWYWSGEMLELVEFTKEDLKPGDILTVRNGNTFQVQEDGDIKNTGANFSTFGAQNNLLNEDLTNSGNLGTDFDIVKVERPQVIWERTEKKTNEELHREMWNWLAENPEKEKCNWLDNHGYSGDECPLNECFACKECNEVCKKCPLDENVIGCREDYGLYVAWYHCDDRCTRTRLAKAIANLPWRKADEK